MGKVILLTGAPATGKSTLRRGLTTHFSSLKPFDYGQLLIARKARSSGTELAYSELRQRSSEIVQAEDVKSLDEEVISEINRLREKSDVILDSHAVTREKYGFRAVPFSSEQLSRLRFDAVLVLRCDPDETLRRIQHAPDGRRQVTLELAREHQHLQETVALTYSIACGCPFFVIDTTSKNEADVEAEATLLLQGVGLA